MDKLKYIKIEDEDGNLSDNIPIGADAKNIDTSSGLTAEEELSLIKDENKTQKEQIEALQNQIKASTNGSPLAADSISEMTDTSRIYVNNTDGYWYYYNDGEWTKGGVYQATEIADGSIDTGLFSNLIRERSLIYINGFDYLNYEEKKGYFQITNNSVKFVEHSGFKSFVINVTSYQKLKFKTTLSIGNSIYALILLENDSIIDKKFYGTNTIFPLESQFVVPSRVNKVIIQCLYNKACQLEVESFIDTKEITNNLDILKSKFLYGDYIDITNSLTITKNSFYNSNTNVFNNWAEGSYTNYIECNAGNKFKITSTIKDNMCLAVFFDKNKGFIGYYLQNKGTTNIVDELVVIPENVKYVFFQCLVSSLDNFKVLNYSSAEIDLNEIRENEKKDREDIEKIQNHFTEDNFEIENLQRRCLKNEKLMSFTWNTFDKAYFAFVIDDCNSFTPTCADLFQTLKIPLSSACIIATLNTIHSTANGRTIKEVLQEIVENGGEVLAHYSGNLADPGYVNGNYIYLTSDEDWKIRTRDVKKKLEEEGFIIRGLIKADASQSYSNKGEEICRKYFDYSDQMGKSDQYKLGKRKFFIGVNTMQEMETWIDNACETPGFYPLCLHGNRNDEPLATVENLTEIINYIKLKGSDTAEITTYKDVFDTFGTTILEKKLEKLNN